MTPPEIPENIEAPIEVITLDRARETLERLKVTLATARATGETIDWKRDPRFRILADFALQESAPHLDRLAQMKIPLLEAARGREKAVEGLSDFVYTTPYGELSSENRKGKAIFKLNGETLLEEENSTYFMLDPNGRYLFVTVKTKSIRLVDLQTKEEQKISFNGKECYQYGLHKSGAIYVYRQDENGGPMIEYIHGEEREAVRLPLEGTTKTVELRGNHVFINQPKATGEAVANAVLFKLNEKGKSSRIGIISIPREQTGDIHMEMDETNLYLFIKGGIRVITLSDFTGETTIFSKEDLEQRGRWIPIEKEMKLRPGGFSRSGDKFVFFVQQGLQRSLIIVDDNGQIVREIPRIGDCQIMPGREEITVIHEDPFNLLIRKTYRSIEEIPILSPSQEEGARTAGEENIPGPGGIQIPTFAIRLGGAKGTVIKGYGGYNAVPTGGNGSSIRVALVGNGFSELTTNLPGDHGAYEGAAWYERGRGVQGALLTRASFAAVAKNERMQNPGKPICISGGSHGGLTSLATGLSLTQQDVEVVVSFNGYYDLPNINLYNRNGPIWLRSQGLEASSSEELAIISPYNQVMNGEIDRSNTPTLVLASNLGDVRVDPLETIAMYIALKEKGFKTHLIMEEAGEHNSSGVTIADTAAHQAALFEYAFQLAGTANAPAA